MSSKINAELFNGLSDDYNSYRPKPPAVIMDILIQLAQVQKPRLVVDIGSGTGLSTFIWAERAYEVIGIEPNTQMRNKAKMCTAVLPNTNNVSYQEGFSTEINLPDGCSDIVTCSQSLHWMDPERTFAEAVRVLRNGGVFAAYDCDWPPTMHWKVEAAYNSLMKKVKIIEKKLGILDNLKIWSKEQHLDRMLESECFRFVKEIVVHSTESGNTERLIGILLSQEVGLLLKEGISEAEIGLDGLKAVARSTIGDKPMPWYFSYRIRFGIK
ncbi:MAG: class I SAM-dependent methyltransferase [Thermodesulfobacteriota bacterium]|nr:class I SAM-dependent methyltransferase [Thermodesulfobacteriota bacterium]